MLRPALRLFHNIFESEQEKRMAIAAVICLAVIVTGLAIDKPWQKPLRNPADYDIHNYRCAEKEKGPYQSRDYDPPGNF